VHVVNCALKMEVRQVRFLEVVPSAIRCLRFCEDATKPKLAVARANGSIELWRTGDGRIYYQDVWIPGRMDSSVESMLWFEETLLTAGFSGHLNQWDLVSLTPCHSLNCQGGPVWCIAANPTIPHQLAVGSEDGMVCCSVVGNSPFCCPCNWH
jgi:U3 small nucleolar RNA-associated protein 4